MTENDDSFDLLGLAVPHERHSQEAGGYSAAALTSSGEVKAAESKFSGTGAQLHSNGSAEDAGLKRYIVRCEGRWRVRSAPSLSSKVIGTIAHGTVVIGEDCSGEVDAGTSGTAPIPAFQQDTSLPPEVLQQALESLTSLWVKVTRLEAQEAMGVSDIKRDSATGRGIYCLRRNAMGYGLYQADKEPYDGPLILLPEHLGLELRLDAQRAASDRTEDVSLTWKLLGAAETVGRFFSLSGEDEAGVNENIEAPSRRRPEDLFEVKQREQLKKAVAALRAPMMDLVKASKEGKVDLLTGLPKDLARRFARLRSSLSAASRSNAVVVPPQAGQEEMTGQPPEEVAKVEGSIEELAGFTEVCEKLERTGSWTCVDAQLRQEVIAFSTKHAQEIQKYVRLRLKELAGQGLGPDGHPSPTDATAGMGLLDEIMQTKSSPATSHPSGALPLLAPPPSSTCSVTRQK